MHRPRSPFAACCRLALTLIVTGERCLSSAAPTFSSTATMSSSSEFTPVDVPARVADLAFSYLRPANFNVIDLPDEKPNFDDPTAFLPLQVTMASYGAVVFSVVARPAYSDGSLQDWAEFLAGKEKIEVLSMARGVIGGLPALMVEARNQSDAGPMRMRTALLEDGKRFLNLSVLAPEAIWASVEPTLRLAMTSFRLAEPRGTTTPVLRSDIKTTEPAPAAEPAAAETESEAPAPSPVPAAELALADDAATLDPEHPFNVRLRNKGAGLTPRVLETHPEQKYAVVGAGAIETTFNLPFGWHVIDDGRRTLVFDAAGKIQISLNLRRANGDHRGLLAQLEIEAKQEQPQIDSEMVDFAPDMPGLILRNYRDGEDVLVQAFVLRQVREDGLVHAARVTATPDDMSRAMNLAEVIMRSLNLAVAAR
jgi:hypothetical protein